MSDLFHYPHVAARLFNTPLMIEAGKLRAIAHGLSTRFGVELHGLPAAPGMLREERNQASIKPYQITNGIGIIPVFDSLVHRAGWMDAMSGLTSYTQISALFDMALEDSEASSILLHIDSPGGEASGVFDLADKILTAKTDKPILAFADMATSAAYLIGSAADQFFVSQSALVGSIGVRSVHVDQSRLDDSMGLVVTEIFAGARKTDGTPYAPLTTESLAALQARINDCYDLFVDAIVRNRGLAASVVRGTEAAIYTGAKAIPLGLVDGVRTLDQLLALPTTPARAPVPTINTKSDQRRTAMEKYENAAALAAAYPDLAAEIRKEGAEAERARIKEILELAPLGCDAVAQECAFTTPVSAADAAKKFLAHQKTLGPERLAKLRADAPDPVAPLDAPTPDAAGAKTEGEQLMAQAAERRNAERRARRGTLTAVPGARR